MAHANSCHCRQNFSSCSGPPVGWGPLFLLPASAVIFPHHSKASSTGSRTFHQLFSSSERFFLGKISTILKDVLLYPSAGRRTLLVLLTPSTSFWSVSCSIVPTWMIDFTNFVPLSFSWSWLYYMESSPSSPRTPHLFLRTTLAARGRIWAETRAQCPLWISQACQLRVGC